MKHSPLPFHTYGTDTIFSNESRIVCSNGSHNPNSIGDYTPQEDYENIKFIVKACNSHYKLLEACKSLMKLIDDGELVRDISRDFEPSYTKRMMGLVVDLKNAHNAIKEAEGD